MGMATVGGLTSVSGIIALLDEEEEILKIYALEKLNELVDQFWAEIAAHIIKMFVSTLALPFYALYSPLTFVSVSSSHLIFPFIKLN